MEVIRLEFIPEIKEELFKMLSSFSSDELKIIYEDSNYERNKEIVETSRVKLKSGSEKLYLIDEVEEKLDKKSFKG